MYGREVSAGVDQEALGFNPNPLILGEQLLAFFLCRSWNMGYPVTSWDVTVGGA